MLSRARREMIRGPCVFPRQDVCWVVGINPSALSLGCKGNSSRREVRVAQLWPESWGPLLLDSLKTKLYLASGVSRTAVTHNPSPGPRAWAPSDLLTWPTHLTPHSRGLGRNGEGRKPVSPNTPISKSDFALFHVNSLTWESIEHFPIVNLLSDLG